MKLLKNLGCFSFSSRPYPLLCHGLIQSMVYQRLT